MSTKLYGRLLPRQPDPTARADEGRSGKAGAPFLVSATKFLP